MALKYEDLTQEQINYCFNGVGSDHFPIDPHDLIFREPAKKHDVAYWIGGEDKDRIEADHMFYAECATLVLQQPWYNRWFYATALRIYCFFLFRLGKFAFEYGPKPETWEELKARVDENRKQLLSAKRKWRKYGGIVLSILWLSIPCLIYFLTQ